MKKARDGADIEDKWSRYRRLGMGQIRKKVRDGVDIEEG